MNKIILDTDIGTDIDDAFALLLALNSKEIQLEAVTTVFGDTNLRSKIARKILRLCDKDGIPVGEGIGNPLTKDKKGIMGGWEGKGFLENTDFQSERFISGVDLIISRIEENPGEITIIAIGPLTNIAVAIIKRPDISSKIRELIVMGGVIYPPKLGWTWEGENNFNCDPDATKIVFNSGIPITMAGLDVTLDVWLKEEDIGKLKSINTPVMRGVISMLDIWLSRIKSNQTCLHDPLALSVSIDRKIVVTKRMHVKLEIRDNVLRTIPSDSKPNIDVCVKVDRDRFVNLFMDRLTNSRQGD